MRGQGRTFRRKERRVDGLLVESPIWWISYCKRGHEYRESAQTTDENKARKLLSRRLKEKERPTFVGQKEEKLTLEDLEAKILVDYQKHDRRSAVTVKHCLKGVKKFFPFDRLVDIGTERIDQYQQTRLSQGAARATVNREMGYLKRGFKLLVEGRQISQAPVIKLLEGENIRQGFLSKADFDKLVENLEPQVRDIVIFLYNSAWRSKEAMTLEWKDVDVAAGMVRLRRENSKNKHTRALPLIGELRDVVERREKERRLNCPFVFHRNGNQIKSFRGAWDTACVRTGLGYIEKNDESRKYSGLVPHDMRRSAVRNFRKAGLSENEGMKMSGHVTNSIYRRYDIIDEDDLKESMGKVQEYLKAQPKGAKVAPFKKAG